MITAIVVGCSILAAVTIAFEIGFAAGRIKGRDDASRETIVLTEIEEMTRGY